MLGATRGVSPTLAGASMGRFSPLAILFLGLLLVCFGCPGSDATSPQLVVVVAADPVLAPQIATLELDTSMGHLTLTVGDPRGERLPLSVAVQGKPGAARLISVVAKSSNGIVVAQRVARVPILKGQRSAYLVYLTATCDSCADQPGFICGNCGTCEPSDVQPSQLVPLADDDDGTDLAKQPPVCGGDIPMGDGDGDGDGGEHAAMDGSVSTGGSDDAGADASGGGGGDGDAEIPVIPLSDASVDALTVVVPGAVGAPKDQLVSARFQVRLPADTAFPVSLAVSSDAGQVLAADCSSAAPTSMEQREINLCLKHTRPTATRTLAIKITASAAGEEASATVEWRMPATQIAGGYGTTCAILEDTSLYCWGDPSQLAVANPNVPGFNLQITPFRAASAPAFKHIELGNIFGCGLTAAGRVHCWGNNSHGELGRTSSSSSAMDFAPLANPSQGGVDLSTGVDTVSAGFEHACAVKDGRLYCWGNSRDILLGSSKGYVVIPVSVPMPGEPASYTLDVAPSVSHTCALVGANAAATAGKVYCWGDRHDGHMGDGINHGDASATPVQAPLIDGETELLATRLQAFGDQTCAESEGKLFCWGNNDGARTGTGLDSPVLTPAVVPLRGTLVDWQLGGPGGCAIVEEALEGGSARRLYCWGSTDNGEFASASRLGAVTPVLIDAAPPQPEGLGLGFQTVCVLSGGVPWCWGNNDSAQLGTRPLLDASYQPHLATRLTAIAGDSVKEIAMPRTLWGTVCMRSDTKVWCWGIGGYGSLGYLDKSRQATPVQVQGLPDGTVKQVVSQGKFGCAIVNDEVYCWGMTQFAQLGSEAVHIGRPNPEKAPRELGTDYKGRLCGLFGDAPHAEVYCWTDVVQGPIAFGSGNITTISVSDDGLCANVDGGVQCAGVNYRLQLGNASVLEDEAPAQPVDVDLELAAGEKVIGLASRTYRSCAVTNFGDLWCWGDRVTPAAVQVHSATDKAVELRGGADNLCYMREKSGQRAELWCEGSNSQHQLTSQTTTTALTFWRMAELVAPLGLFESAGPYNMATICAKDAEGLKCWGNNQNRQRGEGPDFYETTPLPVMAWSN
ncbi:MAG: hypothetical protein QM778_24325 [Myxococcales bacterium]